MSAFYLRLRRESFAALTARLESNDFHRAISTCYACRPPSITTLEVPCFEFHDQPVALLVEQRFGSSSYESFGPSLAAGHPRLESLADHGGCLFNRHGSDERDHFEVELRGNIAGIRPIEPPLTRYQHVEDNELLGRAVVSPF